MMPGLLGLQVAEQLRGDGCTRPIILCSAHLGVEHRIDIARLDLKVNLLLDMVGQLLVQSHPRPRATSIRFNALGAVWQGTSPAPVLGNQGVLEVYLRDCIAEPLRLVGRIASISPDGRVKARFIPPGEHIADLLEKLAFRKHRRQVAGAKHPKKM